MRTWFLTVALCVVAGPAAAGAPRFVAVDPAHAELARRAWTAATACTGWEAEAHEQVEILTGFVEGGLTGGARIDSRGLAQIEIAMDLPERALVHEVAHGWARGGPAALNEGRADLLADCMVRHLAPARIPLDPDPGGSVDAMPDLRTWKGGHRLDDEDDEAQHDAYLGSGRLLRVIARVLSPEDLFPQDGHLTWRDLEKRLTRAGPAGITILTAITDGVQQQRAVLSDRDHDGVPWLGEVLDGTHPDLWDSDGDGWWDGAPPPASLAAIPLPPDGTPVCSGFAARGHSARVQVLTGGELRGEPAPEVRVHAGDTVILDDPTDGVRVGSGKPVLLALERPMKRASGGAWAMVGGTDLTFDWNCRSNPSFTVWVDDARAAPLLDEMVRQLEEHVRRADSLLGGPSRRRPVIVLGASTSGIEDRAVVISTGHVEWAVREGRADALAAMAIALHRIWLNELGRKRWDTTEAFARALVDDPPDILLMAVDEAMTDVWEREARACADGWDGVLSGVCEPTKARLRAASRRRSPEPIGRRERGVPEPPPPPPAPAP